MKSDKKSPKDEQDYLVYWLRENGEYSSPCRAYYDANEDKFFSLEHLSGHPLHVDHYEEMPKIK